MSTMLRAQEFRSLQPTERLEGYWERHDHTTSQRSAAVSSGLITVTLLAHGQQARLGSRKAIAKHGKPHTTTVDHGTEFTGRVLDDWAYQRGVLLDFIRPGKPVENCFIESEVLPVLVRSGA